MHLLPPEPPLKVMMRPILPFVMPALALAVLVVWAGVKPAWFPPEQFASALNALQPMRPHLPHLLLGLGFLLAWRFHQTGMLLCAWLLGTAYWTLGQAGDKTGTAGWAVLSCLVSLEALLFSRWRWRHLPGKTILCWLALLTFQAAAFSFLFAPNETSGPAGGVMSSPLARSLRDVFSSWAPDAATTASLVTVVFAAAALWLAARGIKKRDVLLAGFWGILMAVYLATGANLVSLSAAFTAAGTILLLSVLEASFFMAYRDELTGLPSRRALNQTLAGLGKRYAVAMIDVDYFKKFNDTFGHKAGDQVLRLLAARLNRVAGGAKPFRYGGEEFTAVFPGKTLEDALPHLDAFRKDLADTPFTVRGKDRKKKSSTHRGKAVTAKNARRVQVTASIGAAEPGERHPSPAQVIAAADKALYRAKKAGRNCVKT